MNSWAARYSCDAVMSPSLARCHAEVMQTQCAEVCMLCHISNRRNAHGEAFVDCADRRSAPLSRTQTGEVEADRLDHHLRRMSASIKSSITPEVERLLQVRRCQ